MPGLSRPHQKSSEGEQDRGTVVFVVTCEFCGQSWHRKIATSGQALECIFCGSRGRLRLGATLSDWHGVQHVEVWLHRARSS